MSVKTKLVNVESSRPFVVRNTIVSSIFRQELTIDEIYNCIAQHAVVDEILPSGDLRRLNLANYDKPFQGKQVVVEKEEPKKEEVQEVVETKVEEPVVEETPEAQEQQQEEVVETTEEVSEEEAVAPVVTKKNKKK